MKHLLFLLLFSIVCLAANAQWHPCQNWITFESTDIPTAAAITIDTANYHHNIWQVGAPHKTTFTEAQSLPNVIVTDTLHPYPINDTSVFILKIPRDFGWLNLIQFSYQLDVDSGAKASVEWSVDSLHHWFNVIDTLPPNFSEGGIPDSFSSSTTGWAYFNIEKANFWLPDSFDTILFRFTFISDSVPSTKDGWMIDDIVVVFYCEGYVPQIQNNNVVSIYPSPTSDEITIRATDKITDVTISNLLGQTIYSSHFNSKELQVDVANFPAGLYVVRVNGSVVRKFVKE